jgi:IS605 OrfB family transposase
LPQISLQTRIVAAAGVLDALSELMNRAERRIHAELLSGRKWTGDIAVSLYREFGISAKLMESAYAARQAKVKSAQELAKLHAEELSQKLERKRRQIAAKTAKVSKLQKEIRKAAETVIKGEAKLEKLHAALDRAADAKRPLALQRLKSMLGVMKKERQKIADSHAEIQRLKRDLNQHKRRADLLEAKLEVSRGRIDVPSICFGTRKLFKAQHHLAENGFASHAEWKEAWRTARSSSFMIEGAAVAASGNQFARLTRRKGGTFDLELRLPEALKHLADETVMIKGTAVHVVRLSGLKFHHQSTELAAALTRGIPVAIRFHRDETGWRIMPTFRAELPETTQDLSRGAVGVDLNAGFVSVTQVDRFGNVVDTFDLPMVTYGLSQNQAQNVIRKVARKIISHAAKHGLPVVSEKLDFARKKRELTDGHDARYARMLSSFAYSSFDAALSAAAARSAILHRRVNPAYTSIIGRVKFARRYGLSVHRSAALAIARRAMRLGEEPPRSFKETRSVGVSLNDAHHVTLELPVRKDPGVQDAGSRHVWSDWNEVGKTFKGALAARRPSRRRKRPRSVMGRNELHSMVCRVKRTVSAGSGPVAGSSGDLAPLRLSPR